MCENEARTKWKEGKYDDTLYDVKLYEEKFFSGTKNP